MEELSIQSWHADLDVSLLGSFLCSRVFGPVMYDNGLGVIINISSDLGLIAPNQSLYEVDGLPFGQQPVKPVTYSVAKSGLIGLTKYLATYWRGVVRANCICPGGIENNQDDLFLSRIRELIPMGRMARKDEYNQLIVFLLGSGSSYLNGSIISADGGRTCW